MSYYYEYLPDYRAIWVCNHIVSLSSIKWYPDGGHLKNSKSLMQPLTAYNDYDAQGQIQKPCKPPKKTDERYLVAPHRWWKPCNGSAIVPSKVLKIYGKTISTKKTEIRELDDDGKSRRLVACRTTKHSSLFPLLEYASPRDWDTFWVGQYEDYVAAYQANLSTPLSYEDSNWDVYEGSFRGGRFLYNLNLQLGGWSMLTQSVFILDETRYEVLSQGQPLNIDGSQDATLFSTCFKAFDTPTLLIGFVLSLIPVLIFLVMKNRKSRRRCDKFTICKSLATHCIDLLAFFLTKTEYHFQNLFLRLRSSSRASLTLMCVSLMLSGNFFLAILYQQFFNIDLLSDLIQQPLLWIDSFEAFLDNQVKYNLTFLSNGHFLTDCFLSDPERIEGNDALQEIIKRFEKVIKRTDKQMDEDYFRSSTVMQTGIYDCESIKMLDPMWHREKYHCIRDLATVVKKVMILNPLLPRDRLARLRRVLRGQMEGFLARRMNVVWQVRYQTRTMAAHLFEPNELMGGLKFLDLTHTSRIFINYLVMLAVILAGTVIGELSRNTIKHFIGKIRDGITSERPTD